MKAKIHVTLKSGILDPQGKAEVEVKNMCEKLLANTIIEEYRYELQ